MAEAIDEGFSGRLAVDVALAEYETRRNQAALAIYELTSQFAALQPPSPEQQLLFAALQHNQEETNRFIGTLAGTVPIPEFFSPENLGRIIGAAGAAPVA